MLLSDNKILNVVHTDGYKLVKVKHEDIFYEDIIKFNIPIRLKEFENSYSDDISFLQPNNFNKIELREFNVEDVFIDIYKFVENFDRIHSLDNKIKKTLVGSKSKDFLKLVDKYGWINWANEPISGETYNYLKKYTDQFGLNFNEKVFEKRIRTESLLYGPMYRQLEQLGSSQEHLDLWIDVLSVIQSFEDQDYQGNMIKNINLKLNYKGHFEIQPISLGAKLIYFRKLVMQKYDLENCKFCKQVFIKKKLGVFCSTSCRSKSHYQKKIRKSD